MALSNDQQAAADSVLKFLMNGTQKEMVIEGFPGCGKSFLTKYLIDAVRSSTKLINLITNTDGAIEIHCTATTNKAARVLQGMAEMKASTIHNLLGLKVTNNFSTGATSLKKTGNYQVLQDSLVIVDEASYIDKHLLKLIRESTLRCKVLYIGDRYQLTAIQETECPVFNEIPLKAQLTGSERFEANGAIAQLGAGFRHAIDTGIFPVIPQDDGTGVIQRVTGPEFQQVIDAEFGQPYLPEGHARILAWSNTKVRQYNDHVRSLHTSSAAFLVGETVVTNKPIFGTVNGKQKTVYSTEALAIVTDVGEGVSYDLEGWWVELDNQYRVFQPKEQWQVKERLKQERHRAREQGNWSEFFAIQEFFADLRAVHAATVYKAQGSTYDKVFIDLKDIGKCHQPMVVARMLHVAVTRAASKIYLYGKLPKKYTGI